MAPIARGSVTAVDVKVPGVVIGVLTLMITASLVPGWWPKMRGMLVDPATVLTPVVKRSAPLWLVWLNRFTLEPVRTSTPVAVVDPVDAL